MLLSQSVPGKSNPYLEKSIPCGNTGRIQGSSQLKCNNNANSLRRKAFLVGDSPASNPFRFPPRTDSGPPLQDPQTTRAFTKFFVNNSRKWGQKDPPNPAPQSGSNGAAINQSWVQNKGRSFWRNTAWVAAAVLLGGGALYGQAKAQSYIEKTFLPPLSSTIGKQIGREIDLGRVRRLTPLGLTVGPCSVGPGDDEFSCGELPGVEIRVLPIASLRRGQLVVDAVVANPHLLVSQKEDWTWLGIPILTEEKKVFRQSSEPNLDARTKVRRLAREDAGRKIVNERRKAARDAAKRGYKLAGAEEAEEVAPGSKQNGRRGRDGAVHYDSEKEDEIDTISYYLGVDEVDGIKAGQHVEERLTEGDEANIGFELRNSVLGAKVWIDTNMLRPVKRRLLRRWTRQGLQAASKTTLQRRNLDRSAAAARSYFQKLGKSQNASGTTGNGASGPGSGTQDSNKKPVVSRKEPSAKNSSREITLGKNGSGNSKAIQNSTKPLRADHVEVLDNKGSLMDSSRNSSKEKSEGRNGSGSSEALQTDDVEVWDNEGFLLDPNSQVNRTILPRMSLSSSWGARDERKEEGKVMPSSPSPKLVVQVEDVANYNRRVEQVDFRKMNRRAGNLKARGSQIASGVQSGAPPQLDYTRAKSVAESKEGTSSTPQNSLGKEGSSQVTIESVKAALVQAIRERHDSFKNKSLKESTRVSSLLGSDMQKKDSDGAVISSQHGSQNERKGISTRGLNASTPPESVSKDPRSRTQKSLQTREVKSVVTDKENQIISKGDLVEDVGANSKLPSKGTTDRKDSAFQAAVAIGERSLELKKNAGGVPVLQDQLVDVFLEDSDGQAKDTMADRLMNEVKPKAGTAAGWTPVALNSVYFKDGTLMLLAFGDQEPRVMEKATGQVKFGSTYDQINVHVTGSPKEFKRKKTPGDGGKIFVKVAINLAEQEWHLKVRGRNLFAPLFENLLEIPLNWSEGRANGEVHLWMLKDDAFPSFGGRVDVRGLDFAVWDAPAPFKGVDGTLFFQGQRLFFHNTSGLYGAIPLQVSGDMDLNPDDGEYRLSSQVFGVEANALMKTLKVQPPPFPVAAALKAVVHCRGPLDAPIFEGSAELSGKQMGLIYDAPDSVAMRAVKDSEHDAAVAAYDRVTFTSASSSFTFNTDNCMAELYGIRATPVGGGEIRGAGNLWVCPEGELDPSAVNVDCSGQVATDPLLHSYVPFGVDVSSTSFGTMTANAKISGALLMPIFDIKWDTPEAQGSFDGAHGNVHICREAITLTSSAFTYDLSSKIHTLYPPIDTSVRTFEYKSAPPPVIEGLDLDLRLRGFDVMGLAPLSSPLTDSSHMKVTGKVNFNGHVPKSASNVVGEDADGKQTAGSRISALVGEVSLSGVKLNQLLVAPQLTGSLELTPSSFKVHATGRTDEHLHVLVSKKLDPTSEFRAQDSFFDQVGEGTSFSLLRGQLRTDFDYQPGHSAKLEVRNLQLDELELASLRGAVQKAELALNFQKRRGQGSLLVRQPRGSGIQGESLDIAARWSGDVITLDKSVLEQAQSRYEMQGEYVLPSLRDRSIIDKGKDEGMWERVMAGQLGHMITSMGRWHLRLDVPEAEVSDMLPVARLLARSSDPAVVSRSKELFLQGVLSAGFSAETITEELEYIRRSRGMSAPEGSPESIPLPGLAELRGAWRGSLEASGGGDGDTYADFDLRGDEWEWGAYKTRKVTAIGDYSNNNGLRLQKVFIQKDTATLHADGTLLGPKPNLHFAVLNFPVDLVPPLLQAIQSQTPERFLSPSSRPYSTPVKGILYMEGDLRGNLEKPQCDVQIRLLDGSVGGVALGKAEMAASLTSANRLAFNAVLEPVAHAGHVRVQGNLPMGSGGLEDNEIEVQGRDREERIRTGGWGREWSRDRKDGEDDEKDESIETGGEEGWEVRLAESLKVLDGEILESGAVQVDAAVKDGGMMLLTAVSPSFQWLQGNADIKLKVRGTVQQPTADGTASFHKVAISSPVLPRPLTNMGGTISVRNNQLFVEKLEGRVGRRGLVEVKGQLPLRSNDPTTVGDAIEVKAESLEVRARHAFSGQVNSQVRVMGSLMEPEVTGMIKLSNGEAYLSQEKGTSSSTSAISNSPTGGGYTWMATGLSPTRHDDNPFPLPKKVVKKPTKAKEEQKDDGALGWLPPLDVQLKSLKLLLGPELRMVYPLILNFAVSGELELNGFADSLRVRPRGTLTFENGDVNLVATQVRLNKDHPNRAKFEPEQGLDPTLDLTLIGADWQLKIQGRARNWQDNIVVSSTRTGEQDALTRNEAARAFESQLAESLLEGDGQLAFKKLAAATVETLMPRIETKGEFGQARWRLVSAPQIPNLLSLDPTTDPFKSLANLSFGAEVEVQLGKHLQASVARRLKESEMATEWTLLYQLNSKLRLFFSSIPSVDNRLLFEYSATSQN